MVQYVLVADAARARLFRWSDESELEQVGCWTHPESRLQNRELLSDGPARNQAFPGGPRSTADPPDAHRVEAVRFARQLAETLRDGRVHGTYDHLVIVAPPKFLGMLRDALDAPTAKLIRVSLANDFTHLPLHQLGPTLRQRLANLESAELSRY